MDRVSPIPYHKVSSTAVEQVRQLEITRIMEKRHNYLFFY